MAFTFSSGTLAVTSTAAIALTVQPGQWVQLQNTGSTAVFLGGSNVATSGANIGYSLANGATLLLEPIGGEAQALYAISATTGTLVWLAPAN
jgi:outer membrane protein assembly factor BamB